MTEANSAASTRTSRVIKAPREALYRAFTDPAALAVWLSPGEMTGKVHEFDARVGGGYRMSLFYPSSEQVYRGKTSEREDRFTARFVELTPPTRIVQAISFDSVDPAFSGEMTMVVTFEDRDGGTEVTILFEHIPSGIRPEDNEAGCRSSLEKLARYAISSRKAVDPVWDRKPKLKVTHYPAPTPIAAGYSMLRVLVDSLEQRPWAEREKVMSICSSSGASSPWCGSQDTLDGFSKPLHQRQRTCAQPPLLSRAPGFPCSQLHLRNRPRLRLQCRSPLLFWGETAVRKRKPQGDGLSPAKWSRAATTAAGRILPRKSSNSSEKRSLSPTKTCSYAPET